MISVFLSRGLPVSVQVQVTFEHILDTITFWTACGGQLAIHNLLRFASIVYPERIPKSLQTALAIQAQRFIFVHLHSAGDPCPATRCGRLNLIQHNNSNTKTQNRDRLDEENKFDSLVRGVLTSILEGIPKNCRYPINCKITDMSSMNSNSKVSISFTILQLDIDLITHIGPGLLGFFFKMNDGTTEIQSKVKITTRRHKPTP